MLQYQAALSAVEMAWRTVNDSVVPRLRKGYDLYGV